MFCTECGKGLPTDNAQFCPVCGARQAGHPTAAGNLTSIIQPTSKTSKPGGKGFGIAGLVLGAIGLFFGLYDLSLLQGAYDYILPEEIGILFILTAAGITLSSIGSSRKSQVGSWGLVISILGMVLTFYLASF